MSDPLPSPPDPLTAATQMVKNGRLDQAREILMKYLMKNPSSEQAWLLMSYVLSDPAKQKDCLERVLTINPNNTVAQSKLAHLLGRRTEELFKKKADSSPPAPSTPEPEPEEEPEPVSMEEADKVPESELPPKPVKAPFRPSLPPIPAKKPKPIEGTDAETPPEDAALPEQEPSPEAKSPLSAKWFRITTIVLVVLVLIIAAVILYVGVIGPAINSLSTTPIPTSTPVTMDFPQQWTRTLTPTQTNPPPPTETPEQPFIPSETTIPEVNGQ